MAGERSPSDNVADEERKILAVMDNVAADRYPLAECRYIGKRDVRRLDGPKKASGAAAYTMDVTLPGLLYARFLTSPYPHAAIKRMDVRKAAALPGVRAVLRYDDPALPEAADLGGHGPSPGPVLPAVAYFMGEPVGVMVAADTEAIAEEALALIEVEWEVRPFVLDAAAAIRPGAPLANPEAFPRSNVTYEAVEEHGDVAEGLRQADHVLRFRFEQRLNTWIGPERPCGVFKWNGDCPEVWVKHQRPHICKRVISSWFAVPMNKVRVHCLHQGASFGGFSQMPRNMFGHYCAAVVAKRTGRPVKWLFNRREDFYGGSMDEGVYSFEIGAKKDGTITAVKGELIMPNVLFPFFGFMRHFIENTRIPNIYGRTTVAAVNKGPNVPVRCEQNANCHCLTAVFNHVAGALGLDPVEVALRNDGSHGHDLAWLNERKIEMGFPARDSLRECIEKGKAAIRWEEKWHPPGTRKLPSGKMHGLGFAWTHEWDDSAGSGEVAIRIERDDGTARVLGCRADVGVNAETAYCQIVADELGLRIEDVFFQHEEDAGFFPMTPDASTNTSVNGFAVRHAARLLKQKILKAAVTPKRTGRRSFPAVFPGKTPAELDIRDSVIFEKKNPANRVSMADFARPSGVEGPLTFTEFTPEEDLVFDFREPLFAYGWQVQGGTYTGARLRLCRQAHFIEVEVDPDTGAVAVTHVVNVNDVGRVINWQGCAAQQYGGTYMALGRALMEEVVHDARSGVMLNGNLLDYKIPTLLDVGPIDTLVVETGMGYGPYGVVGVGEDIASALPAILAPAVFSATGVWVEDYPVTPDRILRALGKA